MESQSKIDHPAPPSRDLAIVVAVVLAATALRGIVLGMSDLNLYGDEAQYWTWAQIPAFGYFSKPPIVAWLIGATTALCGDGEACVRIAAPLLHGATSLVVFALARDLLDRRTAMWSAVVYATLPAVSLSSLIVSTDVPLLFFWSVGLLCFHRAIGTRHMAWAAASGLAIGLGMLSKYAMAYFLLCGLVYCLSARHARWFLRSRQALVALALAALVVSPNVLWNLENGWATFAHTAANAQWAGPLFHPDKMLEFIASQFGVFGPILFAALLAGVVLWRPGTAPESDRFLLAFSLPILAVVVVQSLLSRANANWAAPTYVAATILVADWLIRNGRVLWLRLSLGLHAAAALAFYALAVLPAEAMPPGTPDPFLRVRGWDSLAREVTRRAASGPQSAILSDERMVMAELLYYMRASGVPIRMWKGDRPPHNHYELTAPIEVESGGRFLFVTASPKPDHILRHFDTVRALDPVRIPTGRERARVFYLYELAGYDLAGARQP